MKILLPVDGSEYTKRMLGYVAAHDELFGPGHEILVFHVVPAVPPHASRFLDRSTLSDYYAEQAEGVLAPIRAFIAQLGWKATITFAHGHAPDLVAKVAESEHVDLVVMGTHGHSALGNVILGSVANGVLARCKTPVLLIR